MDSEFGRGSQWRKWDLHVHSPYSYESSYVNWDTFFSDLKKEATLHDVEVVGINDYFTVDGYERLINENEVDKNDGRPRLKLSSGKHLYIFPVIELRLDHFGDGNTAVNIHIVFNPKITPTTIRDNFLEKLDVAYDGVNLSCKRNDLIKIGYASVNKTSVDVNLDIAAISEVTQDAYIKQALNEIVLSNVDFETKANAFRDLLKKSGFSKNDFMIIIANRGHGGLDDFKWHDEYRKAGRSSTIRKNLLHIADACFSNNSGDRIFLLGKALPKDMTADDFNKKIGGSKPCIWGSDAHESKNLFHPSRGATEDYTWIKSNPTFEGLQQICIEPTDRVAIQPTRPDEKTPYKVIDRVTFSGSNDFPNESIALNGNLCSVIGSRSSGKSALLAYIAHAIDPEDTVRRQLDSQDGTSPNDIGPAAGKTWAEVAGIKCEVTWASGDINNGKVVYIPQNYLFSISNRPSEITHKIKPVLFKQFPEVEDQYSKTVADVETSDQAIENAVNLWFDARSSKTSLTSELKELGDKASVIDTKKKYQTQIDALKGKLSLTEQDVKDYQAVTVKIAQKAARIDEINKEGQALSPFVKKLANNTVTPADLSINLSIYPSIESLPPKLNTLINEKIDSAKAQLIKIVKSDIIAHRTALIKERDTLTNEVSKLKEDNKALIERNEQNKQLEKLVTELNKQDGVLAKIQSKEKMISQQDETLKRQAKSISDNIRLREEAFKDVVGAIAKTDQSNEQIKFGIEYDYDPAVKKMLADRFNRQSASPYLDGDQQMLDVSKVRSDPGVFLEALYSGSQKIKNGLLNRDVARETLSTSEEIRCTATMEGDRIGGFARSSMTPGKRALFALTLMLNEADDAWPLLIDQPEDDLDSRSIYEQIVPYLVDRKRERQIIMVSHNANLVVGADSEQIIVANKHGDDRKNESDRMFDYRSGALEDSKAKEATEYTLDACGIREHTCEVLDGGTEAFRKRKNKYRL